MEMQQTVAGSAVVSGIALHTGARATVRLQPAPEDTGIIFAVSICRAVRL